jgi:adenine-specific DNA-methyltransferase
MSRLTDLLARLRAENAALAADLEREVAALSERRSFGLNFERHVPEAVDLPGRKVRKGDKVRILPPRGEKPTKSNDDLWLVVGIDKVAGTASLEALGRWSAEDDVPTESAALDDLVVVAEFRDPIYPGLVSTGKVERGGDKPFHTVINAENYHALQTLLFTHRGKVDCIYIDPPYNTGAKDWKYNNDYVEGDDLYRHSKWLAFMERRLLLAKELLNPANSALIVTIDEKEYLRLGLLLEQVFTEGKIQMVSIRINPSGVARAGDFRRSDEYAFFVRLGDLAVSPCNLGSEWLGLESRTGPRPPAWNKLRRTGTNTQRTDRPNLFYPLFVDANGPCIRAVGEPLPLEEDRGEVDAPDGTEAVWPIRADGSEGNWQIGPETLRSAIESGFVMLGKKNDRGYAVYYLKSGEQQRIRNEFEVVGRNPDGSVQLRESAEFTPSGVIPTTQWFSASHDSATHGSRLLQQLIPGRKFPFPKSLYAVEDSIMFCVGGNPDAVVLDFFAGSGTTTHAVMRLNEQDGGNRVSIAITNNEVAADEQQSLIARGLRRGDEEWDSFGICDFITKPRIKAAATGRTPDGAGIKGSYRFRSEGPMADGFEENVEFFTLTYESPLRVASHREFEKIAPLLWMRAGSRGRRIEDVSSGWDVADAYGVLADLDLTDEFLDAVAQAGDDITTVFVVTDEDRLFEAVVQGLPHHVEPVRLYESYMRNFEIESGRGAL